MGDFTRPGSRFHKRQNDRYQDTCHCDKEDVDFKEFGF